MKTTLTLILLVCFQSLASAHDTWVQTNTNLVRTGDAIYVDLMLGNHGNEHRDFKLAGKVDPASITLDVAGPDGAPADLKPSLVDQAMAPKEGYFTARFIPLKPGLYRVSQTSDKVVDYAPTRSIKSAKAYFVASKSLDGMPVAHSGFDAPLGHALELVPKVNPVVMMGSGSKFSVQLLLKGKPLANTKVSFIPRGQTLKEGLDERYERMTDENGMASFEPAEANLYLVVAHHADESEKGEGYTSTKYSATLTLWVPAICACCGE